ncbi:LuxR C-terminal-related transcriptional regulator [Solirubrobacter ginsenosidimutans]|uniref:LuxR C-terminal-related transcriptional regulator n=1 Tax=Solirubrobacter ginsenosidimutans TaxID=490573 RepID=A0A9X3MNF3_9ACTN|nr:LuxR C-terminal-related transcriptional regulator [Solirubrobacter ginsenosidimutans]MDA0158947.1 LuxR C-terminal-related transcriptional regulator [Solirubrobacter ginsenosidimutans]
MNEPVRRSKVTPPRSPTPPVDRPRVHALLGDAAARPVTLVSASAGFGKTVAAEAWLRTRRLRAAWITLDAHDDDPLHLWRYVVAAVARVLPGVGNEAMRRLRRAESTAEPAIEALLEELEEDRRPLTIVLDDLQELRARRALDTIGYAADRLPRHVRLVLLTRSDPALRLPRMRANGRLAEVRDADLRFTREEARELLSEQELDAVYERSEGWPVALQLAQLRGPDTPLTGRRRDIAAYLAAEVLAEVDEDLRDFLLHSSLLPRMSAELCDSALARANSAAMLGRVVHANLFAVSLDDEGVWYRYNALFAEYLRLRLAAEHAQAAAPLHRRAADWFEAHGLIEDAVEQASKGDDLEFVARALEAHQMRLSRAGRSATIERWMGLLPPSMVAMRPGVLTAGALAAGVVARPRPEVRRMLAQAGAARDAHPDQWTGYHEAARTLLAATYGDDDVAATLDLATRALDLSREDAETLVVPAMAMLALARLLTGDLDGALALARETIVHPDAADRPFGHVGALAVEAIVAAERENSVVASRFAERALHEAARAGVLDSAPAACGYFAEALASRLAGRPADAERALRRALRIEPAIDGGALHVWLLTTLASVLARRGLISRAQQTLAEARGLMIACDDPGPVARHVEAVERELEAAQVVPATAAETLSPAELAVLREFGTGRTARDIGAALFLSANTVKSHIRAIYRKLGVASRDDAVSRGIALGLLENDSPG